MTSRDDPTKTAHGAAPDSAPDFAPDSAQRGAQDVTAHLSALKFGADGLISVIAQQYNTRDVLMVAWMDAEALRRTIDTGAATYFSRSRQQFWVKGESSGHTQRVIEIRADCDGDALLMLVDQTGPACHTGTHSCFDGRTIHHA